MNKFVLGFVVIAVLAVALGTAGYVYAQAPVPGSSNGTGMMGGRGGTKRRQPGMALFVINLDRVNRNYPQPADQRIHGRGLYQQGEQCHPKGHRI